MAALPEAAWRGEETGFSEGRSSTHEFVVDPLDGTTNFLCGIPHFAVSIALRQADQTICGVVFGVLVVLMMLPMEFPDKRDALMGAFLNRFGVGFVIGAANLPLPGWAAGLIFGLLLSLPDAIITKAYAPILGIGAVGGGIIGWLASHVVVHV